MKKKVLGILSVALGMFLSSCGNGSLPAVGSGVDSAEVEIPAEADTVTDVTPDITALLEKVKEEGDNWDEYAWKDCLRQVLLAQKPERVAFYELTQKMLQPSVKEEEIMAQLHELETKYADLDAQIEELVTLVEANPVAARIYGDEEWTAQIMAELEIPAMK